MNNKGQLMGLLIVVIMIVGFMGVALIATLAAPIITFTADTLDEATSGLGMVGDANMTFAQEVSVGTANTAIQSLKWVTGIALMFGLLGIIILAGVIRINPSPVFIGFFLLLAVLLVAGSIFVSNTYEDFLNDGGEIGTEMMGMPIQNFLMLYLPQIITVIVFIGGIIIFSGIQGDAYQ